MIARKKLVVLGVAATVAVLSRLFPRAFAPLTRLVEKLQSWLGLAILALVYWLAVTPIGLLLRLLGRSPLRGSDAGWVPHSPRAESAFDRQA